MDFRISDTFTASLAKLAGDEQKLVKTTAFDLQMDPVNPGMQLHKLDRAKDKRFWSVRVGRDLRLIVHKSESGLLLCYVGHHDAAYEWAERRKIERHPTTGAAQLVEVRETVQEIAVPVYVEQKRPKKAKPRLFSQRSQAELLSYGVPAEWIADVQQADEDTLFELTDRLPREAAEALLSLATGEVPKPATTITATADPFTHPDAQRRFRLMVNTEELSQALDYPWEKWLVFLHPSQRELVERRFNGPARVAGSAGTGKTVVALHRAVHLAKQNPSARILVTTFNDLLATALVAKLRVLAMSSPSIFEQIEVYSTHRLAERLYRSRIGPLKLATDEQVRDVLRREGAESTDFSQHFVWTEWRDIVDAWQLRDWESYRNVPRLGRKTRLRENQRQTLWTIFERTHAKLTEQGLSTRSGMMARLSEFYSSNAGGPYEALIIDEAQDIGVPELRFLAALAGDRSNSLFFAGDLGQRIFQPPFSWKSLGVDVRGRSHTLRINYRTSHQIRNQADRLLPAEVSDVDGNKEIRKGTISAFEGPDPTVLIAASESAEISAVAQWIKERVAAGVRAEEIGIFVRTSAQFSRAEAAAKQAGVPFCLADDVEPKAGTLSIMTMHNAKGLEFRTVAVMACDDEVLPLQTRIESASDDSELEDVYDTERHLLYVACTRARDHLLVSGIEPASEFLDDLRSTPLPGDSVEE
jgi:mRNA-degrading endonuclease RelE of RelBE toxin-antitoxin system